MLRHLCIRAAVRCLIAVTSVALLAACTNDPDTTESGAEEESSSIDLARQSVTVQTAESAGAVISFSLEQPLTAGTLVIRAGSNAFRISKIVGPNSRVIFDVEDAVDQQIGDYEKYQPATVALPLPLFRSGSPRPLPPGEYIALIESTDTTSDLSDLNGELLMKSDPDLSIGLLPLTVVLTGPVSTTDDTVNKIKEALGIVDQMLSRSGVAVSVTYEEHPEISGSLPNPKFGDPLYQDLSKKYRNTMIIAVGVDVRNLTAPENSIAQGGGIGMSPIPSMRSAVAVSLSAAGGGDGIIDSDNDRQDENHTSEVRLMAEAIAHEILHGLGLRNTVDFQGNQVVSSDLLDTPKCITLAECADEEVPAQNILFPFILFPASDDDKFNDEKRQYIAREFLSPDQESLIQRSLFVR